MFDNLKKYKKIIIGAVVVVALFFVYTTFFAGDGVDDLLVSQPVGGVSGSVNQGLLASLLQIKSITLDDSIFRDEGLQALEDFAQEVLPQQVGRPNPFLPIGIDPEAPETEETIGGEEEEEVTPES